MRQSTLLLVNTIVTYARMTLTVGLGLAATRFLMRALGFEDFGLTSVLGASGALVVIISDAFTSSTQRHLAYEIGRGDSDRVTIVFNTALALFVTAGLAVLLVGSSLSPIVMDVLTIPPGRERAAFWVFELTLLNLAISMMAVPFSAIIDAHQAMVLSAVRDLFFSCAQLAAILLLFKVRGDKLIAYAILTLIARAAVLTLFALVVIRIFPESRPKPARFRRKELSHIAAFAGWASLTSLAWQFRSQGSTILLNVAFGPIVNSAYAIANQVAGYQQTLGGAIAVAARSATVHIHARGATESLKSLVLMTCKYTTLVMLLFLVPVQIEISGLLQLWLKDYPALTPTFVRIALIWMVIFPLSAGHRLAALARGNLARYALLMSSFDLLVLIAGAIEFFVLGLAPVWLLATAAALTAGQVCTESWYIGYQIGISFPTWLWRVVRPVLLVAALGLISVCPIHYWLDAGLPRLLAVVIASTLVIVPASWLLALEPWERNTFRNVAQTAYHRTLNRFGRLVTAGSGQV
ncbi:MAG TPA: hypothetical protein VHP11_07055 [Tepidisphaeraceae bacterium]|nr:hypothetical protein [Tepidisphaeraceae bacterium]